MDNLGEQKMKAFFNASKGNFGKKPFYFENAGESNMSVSFKKNCYIIDPKAFFEGRVPQVQFVSVGHKAEVVAFVDDCFSLVRFASGDEAIAFTCELE